MPRIALRVTYDGRGSIGWQTQPGGEALQDELERALAAVAHEAVSTVCAGRTDAGVHAVAQVIHFDTNAVRPLEAWVRGVNAHLTERLAVAQATEAPGDFHARFSASRRRYHYVIYRSRMRRPLLAGRAGRVHRPLDVSRMSAGAAALVGTHDFSAFRSSQCQAASPVRVLERLSFSESADLVAIEFVANAFLHHMVRNIVGSLVEVGTGRRPVEWIAELLASRNRTLAAGTFTADGLYLSGVDYDGAVALDSWPPAPPGLLWG